MWYTTLTEWREANHINKYRKVTKSTSFYNKNSQQTKYRKNTPQHNEGHIWKAPSPGASDGKESACNAEDPDSMPGSGRYPGEGNGNPLQYSCLENPRHRGAWWTTVYGVTKGRHYWGTNTFTSHETPTAYITLSGLNEKRSLSSKIRKKTRLLTLSECILFEILYTNIIRFHQF